MSFSNGPRQRPGRPVSASVINNAAAAGDRLSRLRGGHGIGQIFVAGSPLLQALPEDFIRVGVAKGVIPKATGTTPGVGKVTIYDYLKQPGYKALGDIDVVNPFKKAADCPDGATCIVVRILGVWHLIIWDCP